MNNCNHTFLFLKYRDSDTYYSNPSTSNSTPIKIHQISVAVVICPFCGQVRHLHEDGTVEIVIQSGKVTHKHDNS